MSLNFIFFATTLKQGDHESYDSWFYRYDTYVKMAQYAGVFVSRDDPKFQTDFMRFFYRKLNKFCFATVDKKLKGLPTTKRMSGSFTTVSFNASSPVARVSPAL